MSSQQAAMIQHCRMQDYDLAICEQRSGKQLYIP